MSKKVILGILIFMIFFIGLALYVLTLSSNDSYDEGLVFINDVEVRVKIAKTEDEQRRGLMFEKTLREGTGMLFVFQEKKPRLFWNKNTFVPLDVIWIDNEEVVGVGHLPHNKDGGSLITVDSRVPVNYVLEVPRGFVEKNAISEGAKVHYKINLSL